MNVIAIAKKMDRSIKANLRKKIVYKLIVVIYFQEICISEKNKIAFFIQLAKNFQKITSQ